MRNGRFEIVDEAILGLSLLIHPPVVEAWFLKMFSANLTRLPENRINVNDFINVIAIMLLRK